MNVRKITSLTALLSFLLTLLTSIILFIVPAGRVAYWSDWHLWGMSKTQWGNIHINLGVLFLLSILLHIYYNWTPIVTYLKNRQKSLKVFTPNFNIALAITLLFAVGTFFKVPPFSSILDLNEAVKTRASLKYGEPPYGHAELSPFNSLLKKMGFDYDQSVAALELKGIKIEAPDQVFLDIANREKMTPRELFEIIQPKAVPGEKVAMPETPPPGTGNKSLAQLCASFGLDPKAIVAHLESGGLAVNTDASIKEIASANNQNPIQFYAMVRDASEREKK